MQRIVNVNEDPWMESETTTECLGRNWVSEGVDGGIDSSQSTKTTKIS